MRIVTHQVHPFAHKTWDPSCAHNIFTGKLPAAPFVHIGGPLAFIDWDEVDAEICKVTGIQVVLQGVTSS